MFKASPKTADDLGQTVARAYIRRFGDFDASPIPGTDGVVAAAFSPDGRLLAVLTPVTEKSSKLRLSKVPVDGSSPPLVLLDWPETWGNSLVWLPGGDILTRVIEPPSVVRIPADGSPSKEPVGIRPQGFAGLFYFSGTRGSVLPGGNHLLGGAVTYDERGYDNNVAILDLKTGEARILIENGRFPQYLAGGHLVFTRGDTLLAVPFDLERMAPSGAQVAITDGLRASAVWADAYFDVSPDGALLHSPGGLVGGNRRLVYLDEHCKIVGPWSDDRRAFEGGLAASPDGRRLAATVVNTEGLYDIWTSDLELPRLSQFVHERGRDCTPQVWHPDGNRLVYDCRTTEARGLYIRRADVADEPQTLIEIRSESETYDADAFLRDGSKLIVTHWTGNEPELMLLPLEPGPDGTRTPQSLLGGAFRGEVSPDGRWLAYVSRASGRDEVYLRSIDDAGSIGREIPVTRDGCGRPGWRRGPNAAPLELWYACQGIVHSVSVTTDPVVRISKPSFVADNTELFPKVKGGVAFLPDGRILVGLEGEDEEAPTEINVVLNWFTELDRRLAAAR